MKRSKWVVLAVAITWIGLSTDAYSQRGGGRGGGRAGGGGGGFGGRPGGGVAPRPAAMPSAPRPSIAPSAPRPNVAPAAARPNVGPPGGARPNVAAPGGARPNVAAPAGARGGAPVARPPAAVGAHAGGVQLPSGGRAGSGPGGGSWQSSGPKSGSITTKGGSTIDYKGAGAGGTTGGGVSGGKYAGGVQVTTPGGKEVNRVGTGGAVAGPGGNAAAGRSNITQGTGPGGTVTGAGRSGAVSGPGGTVAGKSGMAVGPGGAAAGSAAAAVGPNGAVAGRAGVAAGPGGVAAGRTGAAVGPGGAAVGGARAAATGTGTYYRSAAAVSGQGLYVRQGFNNYNCFRPGWYAKYPGAWAAAGLTAAAVWSAASWGTVSGYCGYPAEPAYYDYGSTTVVEGDTVYVNGESAGTTEQYAEQAQTIADTGQQAKPPEDEKWQSLGVFAMVQGEETTAYNLFQLAINKDGIIRGNYYNTLTDSADPVAGSVDKKTQRVAWTVGGRKSPVFEAGIGNLTKSETTMLVHFGKDKSQQMTLVRIEEPKEGQPGQPQ